MTESIPATWNNERDAAFFGITAALVADGFPQDWTTQVAKVVADLIIAESWESLAARSVACAYPQQRHEMAAAAVRTGWFAG